MIDFEAIPIEELDVSSPQLFMEDTWAPYFKRLRQEKPIHYCPVSPYGPYWSITRLEDIQAIELDYKTYSSDSARGGIRIDNRLKESFISSDPPRHTIERKTIAPVSSPTNLSSYEIIIRERTKRLIASLPPVVVVELSRPTRLAPCNFESSRLVSLEVAPSKLPSLLGNETGSLRASAMNSLYSRCSLPRLVPSRVGSLPSA